MVVRGEDCERAPVGSGCAAAAVDKRRKFACAFEEFGPDGMSALADACRRAGLLDLFLTSMKIYPKAK